MQNGGSWIAAVAGGAGGHQFEREAEGEPGAKCDEVSDTAGTKRAEKRSRRCLGGEGKGTGNSRKSGGGWRRRESERGARGRPKTQNISGLETGGGIPKGAKVSKATRCLYCAQAGQGGIVGKSRRLRDKRARGGGRREKRAKARRNLGEIRLSVRQRSAREAHAGRAGALEAPAM
jgi:hypothetical protein